MPSTVPCGSCTKSAMNTVLPAVTGEAKEAVKFVVATLNASCWYCTIIEMLTPWLSGTFAYCPGVPNSTSCGVFQGTSFGANCPGTEVPELGRCSSKKLG